MNDDKQKDRLFRETLSRGIKEFRKERYEKARDWFQKAVGLAQESAEAHAWLAAAYGKLIDKAWSLPEKVELLGKLEEEVETALALEPELPLARRMKGAMLLYTPEMLGGDPEAAAAEFRYLIGRGMRDAEVWVLLAECCVKTEAWPEAEEALREALAAEPEHPRALELMNEVKPHMKRNKG